MSVKPPCKLSPRAQQEWNRVAADVQPSDVSALAMYCEQVAQAEHWQKVFDESLDDKVKQKAAVRIRDCCVQVKALAVEFGLTPAARKRLERPEVDRETADLDAFLSEGS